MGLDSPDMMSGSAVVENFAANDSCIPDGIESPARRWSRVVTLSESV